MAITSPLDITGCITWLDASDTSTLFTDTGKTTPVSSDGDAVAVWEDKSTSGIDVQQTTASDRPLYKTGIFNGLSVLRFDGSNDCMVSASDMTFTQEYTLVAVAQSSAAGLQSILDADNNTGAGRQFQFRYNGSGSLDHIGFNTSETAYTDSEPIPDTNPHIFYGLRTTADVSAYVDNTNTAPVSSGGTNPALTMPLFVGRYSKSASQFLNGDEAEIIIYNKALNSTELADVYDYLYNKWLSTNLTVEPSTGSLTYTGQVPTIPLASPTTGSLTYTGQTPSFVNGVIASPTTGSLTYTGQTPSFVNNPAITPSSGTLTYTGQTPTFASTATATAAGTFPALTGSATSTVDGFGAGVFPALTGEGKGAGRGAGVFPALTGAATGDVGRLGYGAGIFPALTGEARGAGVGQATFPALTGAATGAVVSLGEGAGVFPVLSSTATGLVPTVASHAGVFPALTGKGTAVRNGFGVGNGVFPFFLHSATGSVSETGAGAAEFAPLTGEATGYMVPVGTGAGVFPPLTGRSSFYPGATGTVSGRFDSYVLRYTPPA